MLRACAPVLVKQLSRSFAVSSGQRHLCDMAIAGDNVEVCILDPRTVLQPGGDSLKDVLADEKLYTKLLVPRSFLPALSQGVMELGDADDPLNAWYFGKMDEIFKYRLMGHHPTMSGFTSIVEREQLEELATATGSLGLPDWEDFKADLQAGEITFPSIRVPFLFAGTVLDSPAAAVYQLTEGKQLVGLAVSSEAAG